MPTRGRIGPFTDGIVRGDGDDAASPNSLFDSRGLLHGRSGVSDGIYEGAADLYQFGVTDIPRRWVQWSDGCVMLDAEPNPAIIYVPDGGGTPVTLLSGKAGFASVFEGKLFVAIPGEPCRVYVAPLADAYCYLSEQAVTVVQAGLAPAMTVVSLGGTSYRLDIASTNWAALGVDPAYVMFDADGNIGATTARVRPVTAFTNTTITFTSPNPPPSDIITMAFVYTKPTGGVALDSLLDVKGFFVWRERLGAWQDNRIMFAGFPGISAPDFRDADPTSWPFWFALNDRVVGESAKGVIQRVIAVDDRIVCGCRGGNVASLYHVRGYPPTNGLYDNQLVVEQLSDDVGFNGYDSVASDQAGAALFFASGDGFWGLTGMRVQAIDTGIRDHERFPGTGDTSVFVTNAADYIVFADGKYSPDKVTQEAYAKKSNILQQAPTLWILDTTSGVFDSTQMVGTNDTSEIVFSQAPGIAPGVGTIVYEEKAYIAFGYAGGIRLLFDPRDFVPQGEQYHIQTLVSQPVSLNTPVLKRPWKVLAHVVAPFSTRLPVIARADAPNWGASHYRSGVRRRSEGETVVFHVSTPGGRGSPRIPIGVGYFGDQLVAGQDRVHPAYNDLPLTMAPATNYLQPIRIVGHVDRIDVQAKQFESLTALIYESDGGIPGNIIATASATLPKAGTNPVSQRAWFPIHVDLDLNGDYFVEVRGDATAQVFASNTDLVDQSGAVVQARRAFSMRLVAQIGAPFISKGVRALWLDYDVLGDLQW